MATTAPKDTEATGELQVKLLTPEKRILEGGASFVVLPASDGELGILPGHAPLIAALGTGVLRLTPPGGDEADRRFFVIDGGVCQVRDDRLSILAAEAEEGTAIDPDDAREGLEEAAGREAHTVEEYEARRQAVQKARVRLHAAKAAE